ncbi:hypothetical protein TanjilG_01569 [Lupinus angustifolius]|uniref:uncharacterized protein LOC109336811 isoform X1 n=1 Tax=Lupinus angustifolius TaxID=3871 RepID=UPI00090D4531|nr:PREDICTED: uncharacterized protein LOC109336811 isoform X1 [Lupinus angustifolius]OIV90115.1 hypothetical protein TanjilG_01569 [Lupinus angustifolius]
MVLGMRGKNRRSGNTKIDYLIHIQEIKPWPPSQSLRSLRAVSIQWKNGESASGSTNLVAPLLGSVIGEGRIEFDESFRLPLTLLRDMSVRGGDADVFRKNCLEFNLYEPRRDKTLTGQLLGTVIIDLADYGILKETLSISAPMNCKRSYRNSDQPLLFIKIEPVEKIRTSQSLTNSISKEELKDNNGGGSVSASTNEEYAEEAEIASFTDDDVSSHSSAAAVTTPKLEEKGSNREILNTVINGKEHLLASETRLENLNMMQQDRYEKLESSCNPPSQNLLSDQNKIVSSSVDSSSRSLVCDNIDVNYRSRTESSDHENLDQNVHDKIGDYRNKFDVQTNSKESSFNIYSRLLSYIDTSECNDKSSRRFEEPDKYCVKEEVGDKVYYGSLDECQSYMKDEQVVTHGDKDQNLLDSRSNTISFGGSNNAMRGNIVRSERLKNMKSEKSPADSARNIESLSSNHHSEVKENGQNSGGNIRRNDKGMIYQKEARNATLEGKIHHFENKIKMLEGELIEAAAIEAALYSVVAEHGRSTSKVHAPARRLSRLYLHACKENIQGRRSGAAKTSVSGLVLVTKACGNDVPRLTFWLSNAIVLRTVISQTIKDLVQSNPSRRRKSEDEGYGKVASSLRWKNDTALGYESFGNWDEPHVFISALERVEAWIFSRIVESIWWQTLTPHMQIDAKLTNTNSSSTSRKSYGRVSSSCDHEQGNLSLNIWKNAFREACGRICPIRAGGHDCGCLPMLPRLIMEQCVARLDVAMFNAILRESADEMPTDPVSDPISDSKVLPIQPGKSSFGAGAQLKTVVGNWSRWLTDLFGMDDDDSLEDKDDPDNNDERQNISLKSFNILNALSDLLMLPKDMLLHASIRKEVCPMFSASLVKKILHNFVPDEFCPDHVPTTVFEALDSENDIDDRNESVNNFPCIAAPIVYSPPSATSIASIFGEIGTKSKLQRSMSSIVMKSYSSDDELDELKSPSSSMFFTSSSSSAVLTKPSMKPKAIHYESHVRYELLRRVWKNSE